MSRSSLFITVVLIAAAAVAGLVALTRTTAASEAKPPSGTTAGQAQIGYRLKRLDAIEAELRTKIAAAAKPVEAVQQTQPVIVRRAPVIQTVASHHGDDDAYEQDEHGDEGSEDRDD